MKANGELNAVAALRPVKQPRLLCSAYQPTALETAWATHLVWKMIHDHSAHSLFTDNTKKSRNSSLTPAEHQ